MLDIKLFRENPEIIKESEKKRFKDTSIVDKVIEYDRKWRETIAELQELKHKQNVVSKEIIELKKKGDSAEKKINLMKNLTNEIAILEEKAREFLRKRDEYRYKVGNILHESVPIAKTEEGNVTVRKWGEIPKFDFTPKSHADLVIDLDIADIQRAAKVVGSRFYYLKNEGVLLNLALINYAFDILIKEGFKPLWVPFLLRKDFMKWAAELGDFEEQLYEIKDENWYLIATAEQPIASYHAGEVLDEKELPIKYVGFSTNFRREAGSHGKDTKGIFRVHQFDKVEQYVICKPEESWDWHEKIIRITEKIFQGLEIPYRIVNIASGEMNDNGAKKYDLEAWFPSQNKYRELASATNTTDYQARKLNIKFGKLGGEKEYVHTLNSTAIATQRTICALIENHQQKDGSVKIPKALWNYLNFKELVPKNA
ncbi:MAG: serine--tRNA ligase [Nanoarchaeota archaeon]|nr:serine--tRNA ligase [Nanoarchaeota archaeon]